MQLLKEMSMSCLRAGGIGVSGRAVKGRRKPPNGNRMAGIEEGMKSIWKYVMMSYEVYQSCCTEYP